MRISMSFSRPISPRPLVGRPALPAGAASRAAAAASVAVGIPVPTRIPAATCRSATVPSLILGALPPIATPPSPIALPLLLPPLRGRPAAVPRVLLLILGALPPIATPPSPIALPLLLPPLRGRPAAAPPVLILRRLFPALAPLRARPTRRALAPPLVRPAPRGLAPACDGLLRGCVGRRPAVPGVVVVVAAVLAVGGVVGILAKGDRAAVFNLFLRFLCNSSGPRWTG
mmetsp:Transcript_62514/g.203997  ORF Transcript_62514/g.203997 Transcript_62514/m.203997 type:complete len:229 (+) Transcript_62514:834-1520(+)